VSAPATAPRCPQDTAIRYTAAAAFDRLRVRSQSTSSTRLSDIASMTTDMALAPCRFSDFHLAQHVYRRRLRAKRNVAGHNHDGAKLADGAGKAQQGAAGHRQEERRQGDPPERRPGTGAQRGRGLFRLVVEAFQHRLHGAHHKWISHE